MSRAERIMSALGRFGKAAQTAVAAQGFKTIAAAGEKLVRIALVPHIPDDPVPRALKGAVQGQGQLDYP